MRVMSIDDLRELREMLRSDQTDERVAIVVCAGTGCQASGVNSLMRIAKRYIMEQDLRKKIKLRITGCHGFCEMGPFILTEPQNAFYTRVKIEDVPRIIDATIANQYVEELLYADPATGERYYDRDKIPFFKNQNRLLLSGNQLIDPIRIYDYIISDGYTALEKVLERAEPRWIVDQVKTSGLRGRGGAGFLTGKKWELLAKRKSSDGKYLVCNADEGDPGAYMDRSILEGNPHSVVEGMIIGAFATGATEGIVYVRNEYPIAVKHLTIALRQARDLGVLGENIMGTKFSFDISIVRGAGAFVCGEETALIRSIEGRMGEPRQRPPFPVERGIYGRPTAINNVETWANVPIVMNRGAEEFAKIGVKNSSGTKIFSLVGKIRNTGLVEVPMGMSIGKIVTDIGGGAKGKSKIKAIQTGGPSGGCIPAKLFDLPIDYDSLAAAGSMMGSGGMIVLDENTCMVDFAKYYMNFLKNESCGKCFSCRKGTQRMYELLDDISKGLATAETLELLEELAHVVKDSTMCGLGQTAPNPVLSTLRYFREEYEAHIHEKRCPAAVCETLFESPCQHTCPVGMDIPAYVSMIRDGRVDEAYRVLLKTNPFPSVCGRVCGHTCESRCRRGQVDEPVAIMHLKRFIADTAKKPSVKPIPVTRQERIAVVGAGPSGLTAALELKRRGYAVTVFEELPEAGGMLRYGIPEYRLPRKVLKEEIDQILATGVELKTRTRVGKDIPLEEVLEKFSAVYLAVGAHKSVKLGIPGEDSEGVHGAVEWLRSYNLGERMPMGTRVAVVGGGNSALDAARSARRLGAKEVTIFYRREIKDMPALDTEVKEAEHEGIRIEPLVGPVRIIKEGNRVCGVEFVRNELKGFDTSGRGKPVPIEGSEFLVGVDLVISAIGQTPDTQFIKKTANVNKGRVGIEVDKKLKTANSKIFAGGDAVTGPGWAIEAIAMGQKAAAVIDSSIREFKGEPAWKAVDDFQYSIPIPIGQETVEKARVRMPSIAMTERQQSFSEVEVGYTCQMAVEEANRCLRCDAGKKLKRKEEAEAAGRSCEQPGKKKFLREG